MAGIDMSYWLTKEHETTINSPFSKKGYFRVNDNFKSRTCDQSLLYYYVLTVIISLNLVKRCAESFGPGPASG